MLEVTTVPAAPANHYPGDGHDEILSLLLMYMKKVRPEDIPAKNTAVLPFSFFK